MVRVKFDGTYAMYSGWSARRACLVFCIAPHAPGVVLVALHRFGILTACVLPSRSIEPIFVFLGLNK